MIQAPIFHVNSDDVEAAYNVLQITMDYRQKSKKDVVIDVIGYRRLGHNEGDEPTYTQPVMYQRIREHPGARALYAKKLVAEGVMTEEIVATLMDERNRGMKMHSLEPRQSSRSRPLKSLYRITSRNRKTLK
jgi:2-oxoglutarate dehydrogenase E1 component